ncbi:MAG TPA: rubredoxin [Acholeplasmataceae bacterium]|nr:rubredoxin [Acholeplasmataceae bacterium]
MWGSTATMAHSIVEGDSAGGIEPGTPFEELPDDWACPDCGVGKEEFTRLE